MTNMNMFNPTRFTFQIKKAPIFSKFVQSVTIPGLQFAQSDIPTPFKIISFTGDHLTFPELNIIFKVNEDFSNYIEIFNWMIAVGFPDNHTQYSEIATQPVMTGNGIYSDATLTLYTSAQNPSHRIEFYDLFPIGLSDIELTTRDTNIEYVENSATFKYGKYKISSIS